jgi:hypothetical protein
MNREKKQMLVLGLLALMIVSVGAFQFMGGSPPPPPAAAKDEKAAEEEAKAKAKEAENEIKNPDFATPLARRDPFRLAPFAQKPEDPISKPVDQQKLSPLPQSVKRSTRDKAMRGGLKFPSMPDWNSPSASKGEVGIMPPPEPKFGYSLIGIIAGANPGAVFTDAAGNQKLVEVGQGIDGDAQLISVSRDKVRVKFHAKTLVLTVGGNPSAK